MAAKVEVSVLGPLEARVGARAVELGGGRQRRLLALLVANAGRVVTTDDLLERVWDEMADPFTTSVKVTISRLRRKLGDPPVIETIAQAGYRIGA